MSFVSLSYDKLYLYQVSSSCLSPFKVAVRKKTRVNDNMSVRVWRSPRLGNGENDDLFPLAGLLNINQLGNMLRPRLCNNRAIILSWGNGASLFCLINMS